MKDHPCGRFVSRPAVENVVAGAVREKVWDWRHLDGDNFPCHLKHQCDVLQGEHDDSTQASLLFDGQCRFVRQEAKNEGPLAHPHWGWLNVNVRQADLPSREKGTTHEG